MDRAKAIYEYAVDLQPEEREQFLQRISSEDPELHQQVRLLLAQSQADTEDLAPSPAHPSPGRNRYIFLRDELIAGRYRVICAIAKGGMGEVYEVEDRELHSRIALKVINLKSAGKPNAAEMFRHEILLARQVTHPNVCRIYDLGHHDHTEHGDLLFLTMEFVRGQTLADCVRTQGPLTKDEALPLLRQMIQALAAAHRLNIAHRDFKSGNVILCEEPGSDEVKLPSEASDMSAGGSSDTTQSLSGQPPSTPSGGVKRFIVKVTDFGLARNVDGLDTMASGEIWGTPDYMAPEQFRGQSGTGSDIYSLGVVIYEMFTRKLPPRNATDPKLLDASLRADAEKIPAEWLPVVQKCLAYNPADRYATVEDVWLALSGESPRSHTILGMRPRTAALVALLLIFVLGIATWLERSRMANFLWPIPKQKHIAVLRFQNIGNDAANAAFCAGIGETLTSKLSQLSESEQFFWVVPFSDSQKYEDIEKARRNLNVNLVVTGSVQRTGNDVRITANLIDASTHRELASRVMTASVGDLNILQDEVWQSVAEMVDLQVAAEDKRKLQQGSTAKPGAYDDYEQGVGHLQSGDLSSVDKAIQAFQRSAAEDPNYALAKAGLGSAYARKYYLTKDRQWISEATKCGNQAVALNPDLAPVREALGSVYEQTGKLDEAKAEYRRALELNPTSAPALFHLGRIYALQGKYPEAEETYKRAIARIPSYWAGYGKLGEMYYDVGRFKDAAAQFQKMVDLAPGNVNGYNGIGAMDMLMGRYQEAIAVLKKGLSIGQNADMWSNLGAAYMFIGKNAEAVGAMQKATELKPHDHRVWRNLADSYRQVPELADRAPQTYRKALEVAKEESKINPNDSSALDGAALYNAHLGNKMQAQSYIKQALKAAPNDSLVLFDVALSYELMGDRKRALTYLKRSLQAGFSLEDTEHEPELRTLRSDPRYATMIRSLAAKSK